MQLANCFVALSGDRGNTVPKFGVTPAEIVVLDAIHGSGSVHDVVPAGDISRPNSEERERLFSIYGNAKDDNNEPIIKGVFPGSGVQLPQTLRDIGLATEAFKALARASADTAPTESASIVAQEAQALQSVSHEADEDEAEGGDITPDEPSVLE